MDFPPGVAITFVDDKGRLKLPADFRRVIELHREWFLAEGEDEKSLELSATGTIAEKVEVDSTGRMQVSAEFKSREVRLIPVKDRVTLMTSEEYAKRRRPFKL